ncbi:leucine-rich melanocyte differentiation-associated protein-like [Centruroides vittatus]|uniref:leucine-rich melanocyte differentiation-associated protein-like n=1 Tax=Centruroides vittatus TaxID=120091 RepID=UPI003510C9F6
MTSIKYITIDDSIDKNENHPPEDRRLNLAYEDLIEVPCSLADRFGWWVQILDLSYNKISDVSFLASFERLHTVILDRNHINSETRFPQIPSLRILWLNHNRISNLVAFLPNLSKNCPNLENLSLMGNVGAPSFLNGATPNQHFHYRLYVISLLPKLRFLDDKWISVHEKDEAVQI